MTHKIVLFLLQFYKKALSPFLPQACRFLPTCSTYAYLAIQRHGLGKGMWLSCKRLCRCHPWGGRGIDYPPDTCTH